MTEENKSIGKFPNLRFLGFEGTWEVKKLEDIVKSISSGKSKNSTPQGKYPFFGSTGVISYSNQSDYSGDKILIARVGANAGFIYKVKGNYAVSDNTLIVDIKNEKVLDFIFYYLLKFNLNKLIFGSGQPLITGGQLKSIRITLPSIEEKNKISTFLSLIDNRIHTQKKIIEKLGTLMKDSRENIFLQKIRFKDDNFSKWEEKKLSDILIESNEKSIKNNQYRVISSTAKGLFYQDDYFTRDIASQDNTGYKILKQQQLVFSPQNLWLGNINVNMDFEIGLVSPSYKIFNFNTNLTSHNYCNFFLKTSLMLFEYAQSSIQGASVVRRNLDLNMFYNIKILLPSKKEQAKIANFLSSIKEKIETEKQILEKLELQKKFLLANLFV